MCIRDSNNNIKRYHNFYMVTGGSNFGRQSGGVVVTAYAPDTVIDYFLLRHQPRFDSYSDFFRAIQNVSKVLLASAIPAAVPLTPLNNGTTAAAATAAASASNGSLMLATTTCYQYADPTQQWSVQLAPSAGTLTSAEDAKQCVDAAKPASVGAVELVACAASSSSQQWTFNKTTGRVASTDGSFPCLSPHAPKGSKCHRCLDFAESGKVDIWDCKESSDPQADNQVWVLVPETSSSSTAGGEGGAKLQPHRTSGDCLTATPAPAPTPGHTTGVEVHEYVVMLSVGE